MLKTGVCSETKDGGAHRRTHESTLYSQNVITDRISEQLNTSGFRSGSNIDTQAKPSSAMSQQHFARTQEISLPQPFTPSATFTSSKSDSLEEEETEMMNKHSPQWLKSNVHSVDVDMLDIKTKPPSALPMAIMDSGCELSENLTDFVFSASLPDSVMVKQSIGSQYFEVLDNGDFTTAMNSLAAPNLTWTSSQPSHNQADSSLSQFSNSAEPASFVSFPEDALDESVNNGSTIHCNSNDLNNILFENIPPDMKTDTSAVEIVQYSDSLNFAIDRSFIGSEENVNLNVMPSASLATVPLTFSGCKTESASHPSLSDIAGGDLTLNSLPNFLGLERNVPNSSASLSTSLLDNHPVGLLEGITSTDMLTGHSNVKADSSQGLTLGLNDSAHLSKENLSITTISISNDEGNATKILVDTHQGQQQMYVINTADLNPNHSAKGNMNQGSMYVINTADLNSGPGANTRSNVNTIDANVENIAEAPNSKPVNAQNTFSTSALPGFVLMPVVDLSANVIQAVPVQVANADSATKQAPKKLLMCSEPGCPKTFKKASKLKVHQMMHTGERPFKCSLLGCEWAFTTSNKLKRHMESHEGRKDYLCDKPGCGHRFTTVYNLNTHRKLHERPCTEPCPEKGCNQFFPTKRQLDLHLRNVHACEDRTFKCPEPGCEKVFFSSGCMGSHMKVHQMKQEDLRCKFPGCGKQFTKMCRLRQHERLHSGERPFICDYQGCTWAFATASKLKRHQTKHTGVRKWVCHVCKKQFHRSEHLKGHLITHSGDRPFVCPVEGCGNTFTAKSSLYVHLKKHDESGKTIIYHCPMEKCEKHYANKASLRQHILVKHCNLPQKGPTNNPGVTSWLSLLGTNDVNSDGSLSQESYGEAEGLVQTALTPSQDSMLATDFLTGGMADQTLLHSTSESIPDQHSGNLISQLMVTTGVTLTSTAASMATAATVPLHGQHQQQNLHHQPQQQHLFVEDHIDPRLLEAGEILQQQERLSSEAVERGKKSQIMLENMHGSARTDPRSNDIISQRAFKRWQKQKEIEAAKLGAQLDAQTRPQTTTNIVMNASGDFKSPISNNVSLAGQQLVHTAIVSKPSSLSGSMATVKAEIPDMELQAEGIPDSVLDGSSSADSFMTELFIRDPETGITYRQTQLLQDDPPNPELMEDIEGVAPSHSMVLDPSLDAQFVDDSLNFHHLE